MTSRDLTKLADSHGGRIPSSKAGEALKALYRPKRSKYRAKPVLMEAERLGSQGEAGYYRELLWRVEAGEIRELSRQIRFELKMDGGSPILLRSKRYPNGRKAVHLVDFAFIDNSTNRQVYQEFKGLDVPLGKLKRAMVEAQYGVTIEVITRSSRHPRKRAA